MAHPRVGDGRKVRVIGSEQDVRIYGLANLDQRALPAKLQREWEPRLLLIQLSLGEKPVRQRHLAKCEDVAAVTAPARATANTVLIHKRFLFAGDSKAAGGRLPHFPRSTARLP